jgi:hypothetical protein
MTTLKIFVCITVGCFVSVSLYADIYEWTDKDGVKHFTNYAPAAEAKIMMKTEELPYDEAADRARLEAEREEQLELTRLELAERKAELERREAEIVQRLAEAARQAEETLGEAEKILNDARKDGYDYGNFRYSNFSRGFYPYHYKNRYYRNETASIFFTKRPHIVHFKRYRYKKQHYGRRSHNRYPCGHLSNQSHRRNHGGRSHSGGIHSVARSQRIFQ